MRVNRAYKFRIYPNKAQREQLAKQFGAVRFVYNHFLRARIDYYIANKDNETKKGLTYHDTSAMLTQLKKRTDFEWLQESNAQTLQQSLRDLDRAYNNFFNKRAKFPKFKKKHDKQSFRVPQGFGLKGRKLHLPKLPPIGIIVHRPVEGVIKNVTISKTKTDRYYAAFCCAYDMPKPEFTGNIIGIDLGIRDFIVTSEGEHIQAPKHLRKSEKRLKRLQRRLSRCKPGSNGREKARLTVARAHEHVANQRLDFLHKLSRRLVDENQTICAESLNVKGMMANHRLAKSIADCGWSEFVRQLSYKGTWYGCRLCRVDRFFPSSKRCYNCGHINQSLRLSDRTWTCPKCKTTHDRDENAARNILLFGLKCTVGTTETHTLGESLNGDSLNPEADAFRRQ